ncbi:MAG: glycosyltransferase involved in cell wall biosynthesis [Planctomycetota bacterium]|jgi:glycosyltransferase involved in cell wall biosynthesis
MKKKIFLGAYINNINAQNINCLSLAKHLDKNKFEVYSLTLHNGDKVNIDIKLFKCFYPFYFSKIIGFLWGIINCDIAYYPKHVSTPKWVLIITKLLGKKMFTTIEINMCDLSKERTMINAFGSEKKLVSHFKYFSNIFPITKYILDNASCGVKLANKILYLGVEKDNFSAEIKNELKNIVFVGSLIREKNIDEFCYLSKIFPNLNFHIIGYGPLMNELKEMSSSNVIFYGLLRHDQLPFILGKMDLHVLLSRSEGFPKVILETASAGIPSIVYGDYGAAEWITNNENGFVLSRKEEVVEKILELIKDPNLLISNSKEAVKLSHRFDWNTIINDWEEVINNFYPNLIEK